MTVVVNFVIIAFVLFLVVKAMNQLKRKQEEGRGEAAAEPEPADVMLLTEIRDLLAAAAGLSDGISHATPDRLTAARSDPI